MGFMLTSQTRVLLLQAGRNSMWMWGLACGASMDGLRADAQRRYDRMAHEVPWPSEQVNRGLLVWLVLPMAALYTALRDRGRTEQQAVDAVTRALDVLLVRAERPLIGLLSRSGPGRRFLVQGTPIAVDVLLSPAVRGTWVERSANRMAVDVTRCYIFDTLQLLGAAPATAAMCAHDSAAYAGSCPKLRFSRTGTLGTGADRCDFCLEVTDTKAGSG
jgi:hypothetical protein